MTGVKYEAGNVHSSGAPDFTLRWRVHVVLFLFTDFADVRLKSDQQIQAYHKVKGTKTKLVK